jgi:hypothetical protein
MIPKPFSGRLPLCAAGAIAALAPSLARASFLEGDALDTMADWIAIFAISVVPIGVLILFWLVHVLPEKIAHKRHHPQRDAITTLCLLSLVFGGLLWPIAWLWAYTRPIGYKAAYGTDKHEEYFTEMGDKAKAGELGARDLRYLRDELDAMASRGTLPPELAQLRTELDALPISDEAGEPVPATGGKA